jgi:Carboxypeptidase regulatory-like domain
MKPIAVLLLVLVAVGALIFGLVTLSKSDKPTSPVDPVQASHPTATSKPPTKIETVPDPSTRHEDPAQVAARAPQGEFVYSNELRVQVVDAQQKPIPDVEVTLTTRSSEDLFFADDTRPVYEVGPYRTGKDGHVSFLGIQPNHSKYTLVCVHPDFARAERSTQPIDQEGVFEEPPIVLVTGATLQGTVKDELGSPIAGATLVLEGMLASVQQSRAPDQQQATTDAGGVYIIKNIPRGGNRSIRVSAPGFGRLIVAGQTFADNKATTRDFVLRVAEMISGRVVGTGNQALAKAKVLAIGLNGSQQTARDEAVTNERGEFLFESLVPGEYNVIATAKGWQLDPQNRIRTGTANLVFEGRRMASVCGQVVDSGGAPVAQFECQLRSFSDPSQPTATVADSRSTFSDGGGNFCLEGVPQGNYVVEALVPGFAPSRSPNFMVQNDRNVEHVVVKLEKGGSISGRLVDGDSRPIGKALVQTKDNDWGEDDFYRLTEDILPSHATQVQLRSGADGTFQLKNLSPGQYQLLFDGSGFTRCSKKDVTVTEGTNANLGDVRMEHGGTLVGTVLDASGKGVPGAGVTLASSDGGSPRSYSTKCGADGHYKLRNVAAGRYKVRPNTPAGPGSNPLEEMRIGGDAERQVSIAEQSESTLELVLPASTPPPAPQDNAPLKPLPPVSRPPTGKRP